jgi:branched-chain amino acid transport system permease protein
VSERLAGRRGALALVALVVVLLALPLALEEFWLQTGLFAMAFAIAAIGLTVLVGTTGQLSLGHAFFVAIGAYGYCYLAGGETVPGLKAQSGLQLPPVVALVGAVGLAGLAGALFSPIAGRLRGLYLGLASLGLVFLGQHIMFNAADITGGFNGRDAQPFSIAGFSFDDGDPDLTVLGTAFGGLHKLWYLGLALLAFSAWTARNIVATRPGRALEAVRDSELAAATMGVDVRAFKAAAFSVSSMYAGLGGALTALVFGRIVPESFGFVLSVEFLVMVVLGGLGSIWGAVAGALLVSMLPRVLDFYAGSLPLVAEPGAEGIGPTEMSRLLYGAAIVLVLLFAPRGLAGAVARLRRRRARPAAPVAAPVTASPVP